jgi:two-component system chemotaxis response regulator CheY
MKALVVDDELVSRKKLQKIMESLGECEAVESGSAAIAAFQKALENGMPFDLITLDVLMPKMDGTEVLYTIREIEKEKKIPKEKQVKILMVTSHSDKDTFITSIQAGCDDYIVKPFDREVIINKLEKIGFKA